MMVVRNGWPGLRRDDGRHDDRTVSLGSCVGDEKDERETCSWVMMCGCMWAYEPSSPLGQHSVKPLVTPSIEQQQRQLQGCATANGRGLDQRTLAVRIGCLESSFDRRARSDTTGP